MSTDPAAEPRLRGYAKHAVASAALIALYLGGAVWGRDFVTIVGVTPWFPPPGFVVAFVLAFGIRMAPAALVAETLSGILVYNVGDEFSAFQIAVNSIALTAVYTGAGLALRHALGCDARLGRTGDLTRLVIVAVVIAPILAGLAGVGVRVWAGASLGFDYLESVRTWATGDALGVVSIAPALLAGRAALIRGSRPDWPLRPIPALQALALLSVPVTALAVDETRVALLFAAILPAAWIALTRTFPTTTLALLVANAATTLAVSNSALSSSEFTDVQLFMAINAVLMLGTGERVRALRRLRWRLRYDANHDSLTGLTNRPRFLKLTRRALAAGRGIAVLFLDLDRFKFVNDDAGHEVGDRVLATAARRLAEIGGEGITVARFGGDEFTILIDAGDPSAERSGELADRVIETMARPFDLPGGRQAALGVSIGIALADGQTDPHELLTQADVAMYEAKRRGGSAYAVFDAAMHERMSRRVELEQLLRRAIEREGGLNVAYQPVVEIASGRCVAIEALARWSPPDSGTIDPPEFISIAEEVGLIRPLGRRMLHAACTEAARWGDGAPPVAVNVSALQLRDESFAVDVTEALNRSGLPADRLGLELTETALLHDLEDARAALERLRGIGVRLVLDDFGTGFSSLSYLGRLPVQVIKIDRQFLLDAEQTGPEVIAAICDLARKLDLRSVIEGVETPAQLELARGAGVEAIQGFLVGRPATAEAALAATLPVPGETA